MVGKGSEAERQAGGRKGQREGEGRKGIGGGGQVVEREHKLFARVEK